VFTAALFTVAKVWKQCKYPIDEMIKMWCVSISIYVYTYIHTMVYIYNTYVHIYIYLDIYIYIYTHIWKVEVLVTQLCLTLCDPTDSPRQGTVSLAVWYCMILVWYNPVWYWSALPFPTPRDLPDPGIKPASPGLAGGFFTVWATREAYMIILFSYKKRMAHEKNEIMPFVAIWMDLEIIMPSQTKTNKWNHSYVESKVTELMETKNRLPEAGVGLWGMRSKAHSFGCVMSEFWGCSAQRGDRRSLCYGV